jgi:hypothetical protein
MQRPGYPHFEKKNLACMAPAKKNLECMDPLASSRHENISVSPTVIFCMVCEIGKINFTKIYSPNFNKALKFCSQISLVHAADKATCQEMYE